MTRELNLELDEPLDIELPLSGQLCDSASLEI